LIADGNRIAGVELADADGNLRSVRATMVVGADGRHSAIARFAQLRGRVRPNNRFFYFAYWRGLRPRITRPRLWLFDPDAAAAFPNEDDLTVLVVGPHRRRMGAFRADTEDAYARMIHALPHGPDLSTGERVSKLIGALDRPNVLRPAANPGVALVGDAALAADPLFGVGCGWAFQTAAWLVDHTSAAVTGDGELDAALGRYRRAFRRRLAMHYMLIIDFASGRKLRLNERAGLRAAAMDPAFARAVEDVTSRRRSPLRLLDPRLAPSGLAGLAVGSSGSLRY
jgi:flavin-dependent dehydrogenase